MKALLGICIATAVLLPAATVSAKQVKHGALEICEVIDGGTTQTGGWNGDIERCCARVTSGTDTGKFYCVTCRPPGSDNCEEDYPDIPRAAVDMPLSVPLVPSTPITGQGRKP